MKIYIEEKSPRADSPLGRIAAFQATVFFEEAYPAQDQAPVREGKTDSSSAADVYNLKYMPHGRRFQVLDTLGDMTERSLFSRLRVPAEHDFFASTRTPRFFVSPFVLDACAQSVGYWAQLNLKEDSVTFPVGAREIRFFGPPPKSGAAIECRMQVQEVEPGWVLADLELAEAGGCTWVQVSGWMHRRFTFPEHLCDFWKFPDKTRLGRELPERDPEKWFSGKVACVRADPDPNLENTIWKKALAYLYLNRAERERYLAGESDVQD